MEIKRKISPFEAEVALQGSIKRLVYRHTSQFKSSDLREYNQALFEDKMQAMEWLEASDLICVEQIPQYLKADIIKAGLDFDVFEDIFLRSFSESTLVKPLEPNENLFKTLVGVFQVHTLFEGGSV